MNHDVLKQAAQYSKEHRKRNRRFKALGAMAAVVVFCTTYALILPAATMERDPICGLEEHIHDESCYGEVLTCGLEESEGEGHTHTGECYTVELETEKTLTCEEETGGHTHGAGCYTVETVTRYKTVTVEETETVTVEDTETVTVEDTETVDVLDEEGNVIGSETVVVGSHEETVVVGSHEEEVTVTREEEVEDGVEEVETLTCTEEETEGHIHGDSCYETRETEVEKLTCALEEAVPHTHSEACYETGLICGLEEHTHADECYEEEIRDEDVALDNLPVLLPEGSEMPEGTLYECADPDGGFSVTVSAPAGMLFFDQEVGQVFEEAELVASLLPEGSAGYEEAAGALDEDSYDGMVAMDIHFEADGVEVEPCERVYVVINALGVLPADADPESVVVQHHVENVESGIMLLDLADEEEQEEDTSGVVVVPVADAAGETEGTVVVDSYGDEADVIAAFEVESFSYFTITYNNSSLTVFLVDENGEDIPGKWEVPLYKNKNINYGEWTNIDAIVADLGLNEVEGYTYQHQAYASNKSETLTQICYQNGKWYRDNNGQTVEIANTTATGGKSAYIHLVYKKVADSSQTAYFYLLKPETGLVFGLGELQSPAGDGTYQQIWDYMGTGTVVNLEVAVGDGTEKYFDKNLVSSYPQKYKDVTYDDETYKYSEDGVTYPDGSKVQPGDKTYYVHWVRFVDAWNANDGDSVVTDAKCWHVDGYVIFRPKYEVNYYVYDVNGQVITDIGQPESGWVAGTTADANTPTPQYTYTVPEEMKDKFTENTVTIWYTDSTFETEYDFDTAVTGNLNLYGKLTFSKPATYTLNLYKVSGNDTTEIFDEEVPLSGGLNGAEFALYSADNKEVTTLSPAYSNNEWAPGNVELETETTYYLVETKAPDGYNQLAENIYFKVDESGTTASVWAGENQENAKTYTLTDGILSLTVYNYGGYVLPSTGGTGTTWMYALGSALLVTAAAAATLVYKKPKREEDRA